MIRLYSKKTTSRIIEENRAWIDEVAARYQMPAALICAVMQREMQEIDLLDVGADLAVRMGGLIKKDSSTGPMQIFGSVGLRAVNFGVDHGLTTYEALGISSTHRLDPNSREDRRLVWNRLYSDPKANIEIAALNLVSAAEEMTGRIDFDSYSEEELKHILTRYNQDTSRITAYGEEVYRCFLAYGGREGG